MQTTVQDLLDTERTHCVCFISITLPVASTTEPHPPQVPAATHCRGVHRTTDPPQAQERRAELQPGHLSGNVLRPKPRKETWTVPAGLTDRRQDNYLCVNGKPVNHWNNVQSVSLDSSVVDLNVSIVTCESPPCTAMGSRKATDLITKSFLYL